MLDERGEYELLSVKIDDDNQAGQPPSGGRLKKKKASMVYVSVSPNQDGSPFSIKDFLLGFGDFSVIDPRKIAARLELFQSPALFIQPLPLEVFGEIEERGNVGCGFIASTFLEKLCKRGGVKNPAAVSAIQVRLFIPSMGIFKGMLQKKIISSGPEIQLPPSMKKVPASTTADHTSPAFIVVCQAGVHPFNGGMNDYFGQQFQGKLKAISTFGKQIEGRGLNDMVLDLWASLGVPDHELIRYRKESLKVERRHHAWIVGTADPTGSLPPDHVFIPGMGKAQPEKIFVTRSPCLRHDHGRLLPTVTRKPCHMPNADWAFLNSLPFGSIIFSRQRDGCMSMPERIACGDLDGDNYLVCWDAILMSFMTDVDKMRDQAIEDDGVLKTVASNPNWLEEARLIMSDIKTVKDVGQLCGKLYNWSMEIGKTSKYKKRDPDAMALADAYNETLEFKKHGRAVRLPQRLIANERLDKFRSLPILKKVDSSDVVCDGGSLSVI